MSELTYLPGARPAVVAEPHGPLIEIAIPAYNEEHVLAASVRRLHAYLLETFPYRFVITIVDNASADRTWETASRPALEIPEVEAVRLARKGRGRALRHVWGTSPADVVAYMDVDLSTDLHAFLPLVAPLVSGHSDLAIGSRLSRGSSVVRGSRREVISRGYNIRDGATWLAAVSSVQSASPDHPANGSPGDRDGRLHGWRSGDDGTKAAGICADRQAALGPDRRRRSRRRCHVVGDRMGHIGLLSDQTRGVRR